MPSKQEPRLMLLAALIRGSCTKCRIPIVIVRIFIRGSCMKCRIPIVIVKIFLLLLFCPKTECAAQTVRARELKPGHIVVVVAGTRNPKARPNRPIGGATAQKTKILDVFGRSSLKIDRRFKKMTSLRSLGQPAKKCITTDFLSDARFFPQN